MKALNNAKIGIKISWSFLIIAILLVGVTLIGFINMKRIDDGMVSMYQDQLVPISTLGNVSMEISTIRAEVYKYILIPEERTAVEQEINRLINEVSKSINEYSTSPLEADEQAQVQDLKSVWETYTQVVARIIALAKAGNDNSAILSMAHGGEHSNARQAVTTSMEKLVETNLIEARDTRIQSEKTFTRAILRTGVLSAISLILALIIGRLLTRSIASPLSAITQVAQKVADGDLTVTVPVDQRGDEIGVLSQAFRKMLESLRNSNSALTSIMTEVVETVGVLASSSSEIMAATTQVASGSTENAAAISQTTTTMEEVRQAAQLSSQKAKNVSESAQHVDQVAKNGQRAVEETVIGMSQIRDQMELIAQTIVRLSEQSQSIGGIIASVTDIADQSNLLAVNAAIEAARAGEHGRGFTVVAQEIKSLAEQSKQATAQVRSILSDVQKATNAAVMATEQGSKAVEAGVRQSAQTGEAIQILSESAGEAVQAAMQIVMSSQQQVVGLDQIGSAMENINQSGAQNASSMRQMELAAQSINQLGSKFQELVAQFKA